MEERVQMNEDTVWYGGPQNRINPDARANLPVIRRLVFAGRLAEAEALANQALAGVPDVQRHYEPLADLLLSFNHAGAADVRTVETLSQAPVLQSPTENSTPDGYRRELDLTTAIATVEYTLADIAYKRECLASTADQVLALRFTADRTRSISFQLRLERGPRDHYAVRYADSVNRWDKTGLLMQGAAGGEGAVQFAVCVSGAAKGGQLTVRGETWIAESADEVLLILAAGTTFREGNPALSGEKRVRAALEKGWDALRADHLEEYQGWFDRLEFELGGSAANPAEAGELPTDERLRQVQGGAPDPGLSTLYFHYGRYLLIAASRPGSLPANLQGIWNQEFYPPWGCKYTININTQMNYWPAESCNLAGLHEPLFDLIERLRVTGREVAREMYGCRGFVVHHNTTLWADACPTDRNLAASYWPMGGAWLTLHLWEHYTFGGDEIFLRRAYDAIKEASLFFLDFLVSDPKRYFVTCPAISPENVYRLPGGEVGTFCAGSSMDSQIIDQLFEVCGEAAAVLGVDAALRGELASARARLPPPSIGRHGQLMEWPEDHEEVELGHRHISHLFALHPGHRISPRETPELARAARVTLQRRLSHGGAGTGWSRAWMINFWARLHDGEEAHKHLQALLEKSTLPNLFDDHPPFQIDGNFGATAAMAEMLVQSHRRVTLQNGERVYEIHLLPALPAVWPDGALRKVRARGGFELDIVWSGGALSSVAIRSELGGTCKLRYQEATKELRVAPGAEKCFEGGNGLFFD